MTTQQTPRHEEVVVAANGPAVSTHFPSAALFVAKEH